MTSCANLPQGQGSCSITGGYISRDESTPELYGRYVYGDYCTAQIRSIQLATPTASGDRSEGISVTSNSLVSFGEDSCGRLYVISDPSGTNDPISRIVGASPADCSATVPDTDPPVVTADLLPSAPNGSNGWYVSAPSLAFAADDGDGSGVDTVEYRVDGGDWEEFTVPFFLALADGEHVVEYRATDREGNVSETDSFGFKLDRNPPNTSVSWQPVSGDECPNSHITGFCPLLVRVDAEDPEGGSGVASKYLAVAPFDDPLPDPIPEFVNPILSYPSKVKPKVKFKGTKKQKKAAKKAAKKKFKITGPKTLAPGGSPLLGTISPLCRG